MPELSQQNLNAASVARVREHTRERNVALLCTSRNQREQGGHDDYPSPSEPSGWSRFGLIFVRTGAGAQGADPAKFEEKHCLLVGSTGDDSGDLLGFARTHARYSGQRSFLYKPYDGARAFYETHDLKGQRFTRYDAGIWDPQRIVTHLTALHDFQNGQTDIDSSASPQPLANVRFMKPRGFFRRTDSEF